MPGGVRVEGDTLILTGNNTSQHGVPAALRFQARVRIVAQGGELVSSEDALTLRGANSALLLIAIATNYRRFDDVGGDPAAITRAQLDAVGGKIWEELSAAHTADYRRLFRRVALDLGSTPASEQPTDLRIRNSQTSRRPAARGAVFPVRALPADRLLAARHAAREPAGPVERQAVGALGHRSTPSTSIPR